MKAVAPSRLKIGVWLEWPDGDISNAGAIARQVAFLAVGAASASCVLHVALPNALAGVVQARLTEIAGANGAWELHTPHLLAHRDAEAAALDAETAEAAFRAAEKKAKAVIAKVRSFYEPSKRSITDLIPGRYFLRERNRLAGLDAARIRETELLASVEEKRKAWTDAVARAATPRIEDAARFAIAAARLVTVDGWLVMSPDYDSAASLPGPRAVIVGDGTPAGWPLGWPDSWWAPGGYVAEWCVHARRLMAHGDPIIVPTSALAEDKALWSSIDADAGRVRVIAPAPVDLAPRDGEHDPAADSQRLALECAASPYPYLQGFPFDDVPYILVWSEGAPGQNLRVLVRAMQRIIQRDLKPLKVFVASPGGWPEPEVWHEIRQMGLHHDIVHIPVLTAPAMRALLRGAILGLYTAPSAGGGALIGWSQAIAQGTPSLLCRSPDVESMLPDPDLRDALFDPRDHEALAAHITQAMADRDALAEKQKAVRARIARDWAAVLQDYIAVLGLKIPAKGRA